MTERDNDMDELERAFAEARQRQNQLPAGLSERILADAYQVRAGFRDAVRPRETPAKWAQVVSALGGWTTLSGLATACAAGVWIGLAPPDFLPDPVGVVLGVGSDIDLIDVDTLFANLPEEG